MIYTVTLNPSLDYLMEVDNLKQGLVNRSKRESYSSGGKGICVSRVLTNLKMENIILGFCGGFTGEEIARDLESKGCVVDFIKIKKGISRINVKLSDESITEINGGGPEIVEDELTALYDKINKINDNDILIIGGTVPKSLPSNIYSNILEMVSQKNILTVVDATGNLLLNVLKYKPFLVKPNHHEIGEIFGVEIKSEEEIIKYAKKMQSMGVRNVLVSRGPDGAILISENGEVISSKAPIGQVINTVGAGDSMVAGFVAGYIKYGDYENALKMGLAAGSASAFSSSLATNEEIYKVLKQLE